MSLVREAILKAADHIESEPKTFRFLQTRVPPDCKTPGCALGWIGYFLGAPHTYSYTRVSKEFLHVPAYEHEAVDTFEGRMRELTGESKNYGSQRWFYDAALCAEGLRAYADKYHPEEAQ